METIKVDYYNNYKEITIEIPKTCPNCGVGNNPNNHCQISYDDFAIYSHFCSPCKKYHYTVQGEMTNDERKLLFFYPNKATVNIDSIFIEHAPRFTEFYSEAVEAEKLGLENIAATGYRSAIECLIKDYALDFNLATREEISKLILNNAIDSYLKDDELLQRTLHFIRKIGNHYTHWDKDTDISLSTLKNYVDIIVSIFKSKFMMKYLPE